MVLSAQQAHLNDLHWPVIELLQALAAGTIESAAAIDGIGDFQAAVVRWNQSRSYGGAIDRHALGHLLRILRSARFWEWGANGSIRARFGRPSRELGLLELNAVQHVMADWTFQHGQWFDVRPEANDALFVDPPYLDSRGSPTSAFSMAEHTAVAHWVADQSVPAILCHRAVAAAIDCYISAGLTPYVTRRRAPGAVETFELVAINAAAGELTEMLERISRDAVQVDFPVR